MPVDRTNPLHQYAISRVGNVVYVWNNERSIAFDAESFHELIQLGQEFYTVTQGKGRVQNFVGDLPTRTPLHANTPRPSTKASLDDLI